MVVPPKLTYADFACEVGTLYVSSMVHVINKQDKLASSSIGGVDPNETLSVVLDVGTDNQELLDDDLYIVSGTTRFKHMR